jgi:ribosomal protein S18 acetylase RimI-like enzyme
MNDNILFLMPDEKNNFSEKQKIEIAEIITDAFFEKFAVIIKDDNKNFASQIMYKMINLELISLKDSIITVNNDKEISGVLILNYFKKKKLISLGKEIISYLIFIIWLIKTIGFIKSINFFKVFSEMDEFSSKNKTKKDIEIYILAVKEQFRGKGIGKLLLEECSKFVREKTNFNNIILFVFDSNPACHLYKKAGFEITQKFQTKYFNKIIGEKYKTFLLMNLKIS